MKDFRKLTSTIKKTGGRSNGQITAPRRGGGFKNKYRLINFKRNQFEDAIGKLRKIYKYSPINNTFVGVIIYTTGFITAIITAEGSYENQLIFNNFQRKISKTIFSRNSSSLTKLGKTPPGSILYNIELFPNRGGQVNRSAGTSSVILKSPESSPYARLKLKSGELRSFHKNCLASIGVASMPHSFLKSLIRPGIRGT